VEAPGNLGRPGRGSVEEGRAPRIWRRRGSQAAQELAPPATLTHSLTVAGRATSWAEPLPGRPASLGQGILENVPETAAQWPAGVLALIWGMAAITS